VVESESSFELDGGEIDPQSPLQQDNIAARCIPSSKVQVCSRGRKAM
jgi:hypothetical protein